VSAGVSNKETSHVSTDISIIEAEPLEYLPAKTLLKLVEKQQQASKNAKAFKQAVTSLPGLFRGFEDMDVEPRFDLDNEYITLMFTGDGDRLKQVWGLLRRHGYNVTARPAKGDTQFTAFWQCEGQARIFMYFTSSLCRRVQIGTETKEVPIYETQCGELPELEVSTPTSAVTVADEIPF
jgi:hypothetical protein